MTIRKIFKAIAYGLCAIVVLPLIGASWFEKRTTKSEAVFVGLSQLLSLIPGYVGIGLRGSFYFMTLQSCSWETHIGFGSVFSRGYRTATVLRTAAGVSA